METERRCFLCGNVATDEVETKKFYKQVLDETYYRDLKQVTRYHYEYTWLNMPPKCAECKKDGAEIEKLRGFEKDPLTSSIGCISFVLFIASLFTLASLGAIRFYIIGGLAAVCIGAIIAAVIRENQRVKKYQQEHARPGVSHLEELQPYLDLLKAGWTEGEPPSK